MAYGTKIISEAANAGAIEILAIDAQLLRNPDPEIRNTWETILEIIEASRGRIIQVSQDHDSAQQLMGLGGALALLRWKMD